MWRETTITTAGLELLNSYLTGSVLTFTSAAAGTGNWKSSVLPDKQALVSQQQIVDLLAVEQDGETVRLKLQVTSEDLTEGYQCQQVGIWAQADSGTPVLFFVMQDPVGLYVPGENETPDFVLEFSAVIKAEADGEIRAVIDPAALTTVRKVRDMIAAHNTSSAAHPDIRAQLASPFHFKGDVADQAALEAIVEPEQNDTYYVENLKYHMSWDGTAWSQTSDDYDGEISFLKGILFDEEDVTGDGLRMSLDHFLSTAAGEKLGYLGYLPLNPDVAAQAENFAAEFVFIRVNAGDTVHITPGCGMNVRVVAYQPVFDSETRSWSMQATQALQATYAATDVLIEESCFIRYGMRRTDRGAFTMEDALEAVTVQRARSKAEGLAAGNVLDLSSGVRNKANYQDASLGETDETSHTLTYLSELQPIPVLPGVEYRLSGTYSQAMGFLARKTCSQVYVKLRACDKDGAILYKKVWYFGQTGKRLAYKGMVATMADLPSVSTANYMYYVTDPGKRVYSKMTDGVWGWEDVLDTDRVFRPTTRTSPADMPDPAWAKDTVYVESTRKLMEYTGAAWLEIEDEAPLNETLVFPDGVDHVIINYPDRAMPDIALTAYTAQDHAARQRIAALETDMEEQKLIKGTLRKNHPGMVQEFLDVARSYLDQETLTQDPTFGRYGSLSDSEKKNHWYDAPVTDPETGEEVTERRYYGLVYGYQSPLNAYFGTPSYGSRLIDCSSYVGMVLRGISFDESAYKAAQGGTPSQQEDASSDTPGEDSEILPPDSDSEESDDIMRFDPYANPANPRYSWSLNPYEWSNLLNIYTVSMDSAIRCASQIAHWMAERGQEVAIDTRLSNIEAGDIVFYTRFDRTEPIRMYHAEQRYRHINHCAIITDKIRVEEGAFDSNGNLCVYEDGQIVGAQDWDGEAVEYSGELWDAEKHPYLHRYIQVNNVPGACETGTLETSGLPDLDPEDEGYMDAAMKGNNVYTLSMCCRPDLGAMAGPVERRTGPLATVIPEGHLRYDDNNLYIKTGEGWKKIPLENL